MHDGDKIGCAEIGRLKFSKKNVIINAFEDRQKLIAKFHKVGKHFNKYQRTQCYLTKRKINIPMLFQERISLLI